jgi:HEAT repeat protein
VNAAAAGDPALQAALTRLRGAWQSTGPAGAAWLRALRPPRAAVEVRAELQPWSRKPPATLTTLYAWCDGLADNHELCPGVLLLGAAEAAARYREELAVAQAAVAGTGVKPEKIWDPRWWPLLAASAGPQIVWFTTAPARGQATAPVWLKDREDDAALAHDSLAALINTVAEGLETGALALHGNAVVERDADAAAALFRRHSPQAAGAAAGALQAAQLRHGLLQKLAQGDPRAQGEAAALLMKRRDREAVPGLMALLAARDGVVRRLAARVLETVPDRRALPALLSALADPDLAVRGHAAMALAAIGERTAIAPLMQAVAAAPPLEAVAFMRALAVLNAVEAIELLARYLAPALLVPVRLSAASALATMHDPRLPKVLAPLLQDPLPQLRATAASGLGRPDYGGVTDALASALNDPELTVRIVAAGALGARGDAAAVPALQRALAELDGPTTPTPRAAAEARSFKGALQQALRTLSASA